MSTNKYSDTLGSFILTLDILEVVVGIIAILINLLALYILIYKMKLKQADTIQSFLVSVFDIIYSFFTIINCLTLWLSNHAAILNTWYSQVVGYLFFCLGACVIDSVMLLSLIRFLAIYKHVQYSNRVWINLTIGLAILNFGLALSPLIQGQFKVQPSLKYSSVEFSLNQNWSNNFYYIFVWIRLIINIIIIIICYFFISLFYYNYLRNYNEEEDVMSQEFEKVPKFNWRELGGIQFETGDIRADRNWLQNSSGSGNGNGNIQQQQQQQQNRQSQQPQPQQRTLRRLSHPIIDPSSPDYPPHHQTITIDSLIRSTLSKLYIMLIIYLIELFPFFIIQTVLKILNVPISSELDSIGSFLTHLIPITNPCFVLFFHFETYQELRTSLTLWYWKLKN